MNSSIANNYLISGYKRMRQEKYYTPSWVFDVLYDNVYFEDRPVYDPAAGAGNITSSRFSELNSLSTEDKAITTTGLILSDIEPDATGIKTLDFLKDDYTGITDYHIVTNPPYGYGGKLAVQFIERALEKTKATQAKVAMLLRSDFDSGSSRRHLFKDNIAFDRKIVLLNRIKWTNIEDKGKQPMTNHAWFVWDHERYVLEYPELHYASRNS